MIIARREEHLSLWWVGSAWRLGFMTCPATNGSLEVLGEYNVSKNTNTLATLRAAVGPVFCRYSLRDKPSWAVCIRRYYLWNYFM